MLTRLLVDYWPALAHGLITTASLSLIVWSAGILIGGALGVLGARSPAVGSLTRTLGFVLGSIPVIVVLMWFHYPAQSLLGIVVPPFWTAAFALSLVNVFVVSEAVRPALLVLPREFATAGRVSGLSEKAIFWKINFPLVLRQLLPTLLFSQVTMLQATLFASLISVEELFRVVQQINAQEYAPIPLYTALAVVFLAICAPINGLAMFLRQRYSRDLSEN